MNRIEGPITRENPDFDPQLSKKKLGDVVSSMLKNEVSNDSAKGTSEHLGRVIVTKESRTQKTEKSKDKISNISLSKIDTMNRADLLDLSGSIEIDSSNLRRIYETKLIGENGLRRLIKEYLKGGDLKKLLRQEIFEREMDFERDPAMRDIEVDSKDLRSTLSSDNNSSLNQLIEKAESSISESNEEAAFYKAKAGFEVEQMTKQHMRMKRIDLIMAGLITLLIITIISLYLTRG
jgi:hypothetical protein